MAKYNLFSNVDIEDTIKELQRVTAEDYESERLVDLIMLKNSAQKFLTQMKILESQDIIQNNQKLANIIFNGKSVSAKVKANQHSAYIIRAKYALAFDFDAKINAYLNKLPKKALYVFTNKHGVVETYEMSMEQLAKFAGHGGRINISLIKLQNEFGKSVEAQMEESDKDQAEHVAQAQAAYKGVINRLARFHEKHPNSNLQGGLLMWKYGNEWTIARVHNMGDLAEAYSSALMQKHKSDLDLICTVARGNEPYYSHSLIATFFNGYLESVSNMAAIREEDVITDQYQYAVKARKAVLPALQQYITAAQLIITQDTFTEQDLEKNFPWDAHRNKILRVLNDESDKAIDEALKELSGVS